MVLTNFTKDDSESRQLSSDINEFNGEVDSELIFLSVVNSLLSVTAFLGNTLILVALHKETSLHPPSKVLFCSLALTDLFVGIIAGPLTATYEISVVKGKGDICYYAVLMSDFSSYTLCSVSLLTLTAISVDRLLALLLGIRYRQVVTLKRTRITAIGLWILSIFGASTLFWNRLIISWYQYIGTAVCLVTTISAYTKIFFTLRHNHINHVPQAQPSQVIPLNIGSIQKGSVQCIVGSGNIGCLLSAVFYSGSSHTPKRDAFILFPCSGVYSYFIVFKLFVKSIVILLED